MDLSSGINIIKGYINSLSNSFGVYFMLGAKNKILYIGKAKNLRERIAFYTKVSGLTKRMVNMIEKIRSMDFIVTNTEFDALLLESTLIKKYKPSYNILLKENNHFSYIYISGHKYPNLIKYTGEKNKNEKYFGPFISSRTVNDSVKSLCKIFLLRSCSDSFFSSRRKPCLKYYIKNCSAPCMKYISQDSYKLLVEQACDFLKGKNSALQNKLKKQMFFLSDNKKYEQAAVCRDRIKKLNQIQRNSVLFPNDNVDVIAGYKQYGKACIQILMFRNGKNCGGKSFFPNHDSEKNIEEILNDFILLFYDNNAPSLILLSHSINNKVLVEKVLSKNTNKKVLIYVPIVGNKLRIVQLALKNAYESYNRYFKNKISKILLEKMKKFLSLKKLPVNLEAYDNSHLCGSSAVGVMVNYNKFGFCKENYRSFSFDSSKINVRDDCSMLKDVLERRFKGESLKYKPDLLLIDGEGRQLNTAHMVLNELGIRNIMVISIAKGINGNVDKIFIMGRDPIILEKDDAILYFLQKIRDEAHRFAITTHRKKRIRINKKSILDEIKGIGLFRKSALLKYFGSVNSIKAATMEELTRVKGINKRIAKCIYYYFQLN